MGLFRHRRWLGVCRVEELNYSCSKSKVANQLRSYCAADLRLCFRICKKAQLIYFMRNVGHSDLYCKVFRFC